MERNGMVDSSLDMLDQLIYQAKTLNTRLAPQYPDLFANAPSASIQKKEVDESRFFAPVDEGIDDDEQDYYSSSSGDDDSGIELNEDDLQIYSLRRKFCGLESFAMCDTALSSQWKPEKRTATPHSSLDDEELFMHVVSRFASGITDEAGYGIAQMEQRGLNNAMLCFLPIYTALDTGASREKIKRLSRQSSKSTGQSENDAMLIELVRGMLQSVMQIIQDAEALQAAGYRNKQEALRVAAGKAQQRAEHLTQRANF